MSNNKNSRKLNKNGNKLKLKHMNIISNANGQFFKIPNYNKHKWFSSSDINNYTNINASTKKAAINAAKNAAGVELAAAANGVLVPAPAPALVPANGAANVVTAANDAADGANAVQVVTQKTPDAPSSASLVATTPTSSEALSSQLPQQFTDYFTVTEQSGDKLCTNVYRNLDEAKKNNSGKPIIRIIKQTINGIPTYTTNVARPSSGQGGRRTRRKVKKVQRKSKTQRKYKSKRK